MSTYDPSQAPQFERLLQRRDEELRQALMALAGDNDPAQPQEVSDFKDVAMRSADTDMDEIQAQRIHASMRRVVAARQRLAHGHYGTCLECGQAIDLRRLQALPEAELCTACQGTHEPSRH